MSYFFNCMVKRRLCSKKIALIRYRCRIKERTFPIIIYMKNNNLRKLIYMYFNAFTNLNGIILVTLKIKIMFKNWNNSIILLLTYTKFHFNISNNFSCTYASRDSSFEFIRHVSEAKLDFPHLFVPSTIMDFFWDYIPKLPKPYSERRMESASPLVIAGAGKATNRPRRDF